MVLVSATTSGSLVKKLLGITSFANDQLITLFHTGLPGDQIGVFNVASAIDGNIVSRKANECDFCKRGSRLIRISGDQFLVENPKHELLVIKKADFDKRRESFFKQFAATNVLGWNTSVRNNDDSKEHFFIDVVQALRLSDAKHFSERLEKKLRRYLSRDLAIVITFNDQGSQELEQKVREHLGSAAESIKWLTASSLKESELEGAASVLVLAGAITSGRSLLAISRKLRGIHPSATITYFVPFAKLPNEDAFKQLEKDLCQGGHSLVILYNSSVPRIKDHTKTAWDSEREILKSYSDEDPLGEINSPLPNGLKDRQQRLVEQRYDSRSLFLPDHNGNELKLRSTFAFWSDLDFSECRLQNATQADVYWTLQCVLHDLRNASENNGLATAYHTTLISPANFDRYNDGVVQACLLRAARPVEMDYRVDTVFSRQMTDVISSVVSNWSNAQGEAALEFLMALVTRRICLNDDHLKEIIALESEEMTDELKFLFKRLEK